MAFTDLYTTVIDAYVHAGFAKPDAQEFAHFQCAHGSPDSKIFMGWHWPPKAGQPLFSGFGASFEDSYSLEIFAAAPLGSKEKYAWHDLWCKRTEIQKEDGTRKTDDEVYEASEKFATGKASFGEHVRLSRSLTLFTFGRSARKAMEDLFGIEPLTDPGKTGPYRIIKHPIAGRRVGITEQRTFDKDMCGHQIAYDFLLSTRRVVPSCSHLPRPNVKRSVGKPMAI